MLSKKYICSVQLYGCDRPDQANVLIELPHGATLTEHYSELAKQMRSKLPENLIDFFYVNTDVGSPELGEAVADQLRHLGAVVLRCLIPRTLIDCNRVIDADPQAYRDGGVTPGLPSYITEDSDRQVLLERYQAYFDTATELMETVCSRGGLAMILHSYAPRSVGISSVGADIVQQLHWAYQPEVLEDWPLRPGVDFIVKDPAGVVVTDQLWLDELSHALCANGLPLPATGDTYPLHPVTRAHHFATSYAPRVVCVEVRRDLLVGEFTPFAPLSAVPEMVQPFAQALATATVKYWTSITL